jgi:hypothetical protein
MKTAHKLYDRGQPPKLIDALGEVTHNGRTYKVAREQVATGEIYLSIKLYNATGKFIKRLMIDEDIAAKIGLILIDKNAWPIDRRFPTLFHDEEVPSVSQR